MLNTSHEKIITVDPPQVSFRIKTPAAMFLTLVVGGWNQVTRSLSSWEQATCCYSNQALSWRLLLTCSAAAIF